MAVPQHRNEKPSRRRPKQPYRTRSQGIRLDNNPYYAKDGHFLTIDETPSFEEWLADTEPIDTIEEMVNNPNRLLTEIASHVDPDDEIGNDLDDLFEDY